jgi:hypothetical protein
MVLELPYPMVLVQWEDAWQSSGGFSDPTYKPWLRQSVGFLVNDSDAGIVLAFNVNETHSEDSDRLDTPLSIPRGMVRRIVVLVASTPTKEET